MSGLLTERYTEQQRRQDAAAALTGEVFWLGHIMFWRAPGQAHLIRLTWHTPNEPFDAEEWAELLWQGWAACGARI